MYNNRRKNKLSRSSSHNPKYQNEGLCVYSHRRDGLDYPWLTRDFGILEKVEFFENGKWRNYEEPHNVKKENGRIERRANWWIEHCKIVNHNPAYLYKEHMRIFVGNNPLIVLRFTFNNGSTYQSNNPKHYDIFSRFYELESDWFEKSVGCGVFTTNIM